MIKKLKKLLHFDDGGQVPGESSSADTPGQSDTGNQAGTDTASNTSTPGSSQAYNSATSAGTAGAQTAGQASAQSGQSAAPTYSPVKTGSGFTNIQKLIGANTNNQLGDAVGGGVTSAANQAASNINNAQNDFTTQSAAANNNTDANKQYIDSTLSGIQNQALGTPAAGSVDPTAGSTSTGILPTSDPNGYAHANTATPAATATSSTAYQYPDGTYAPTASDTTKFGTLLSGQYNGPTQLNNLNNLQTQGSDVTNLQNSLNSQEGRQGLLQRFVGGNSQYGQGEQNLDALLLGQTGGKQLSQARLATQGMPDINNLSQADTGVAQTYQNGAQDIANYAQYGAGGTSATPTGGIVGTGQNINAALTNQATAASTASQNQLNQLYNDYQNNTLTPDELNQIQGALGVSANGPVYGTKAGLATGLFGTVTPNSGTNADGTTMTGNTFSNGELGAQTYTPNQLATQQQYAAQQALSQLAGGVTPDSSNLGGLNINQSLIGTAPTTPISVNATNQSQSTANQTSANNDFNTKLAAAGLSLPEYNYLNGTGGVDELSNLQNIYNQVYDTPLQQANLQATQQQITPELQQAIAGLQNYDTTNNSQTFNPYIQQLQGIDPNSMTSGGGINAVQQPINSLIQNLTNLHNTAGNLGTSNNYFSNLSSLLNGNSPTSTGPGKQIIPGR